MTDAARDGVEFSVGRLPSLDVSVEKGSLEVRNGRDGRISVWLDRPDEWGIGHVGDSVRVEPASRWRSRSGRIVVEVPPGTRVEVKSASARMRLEGEFGEVVVSSASGDLAVGGRCSDLSVTSASGDVRCEAVRGDAEAKSASGDIDVGNVGGRVAVTTTSGDVRVHSVGADLAVATASGDVEVRRGDGDAIAVRTVSGDVHIGLPGGIRVSPNLSTFSGRTRLPEPLPASDAAPAGARRLVRVNVKTVSGDIVITRAD